MNKDFLWVVQALKMIRTNRGPYGDFRNQLHALGHSEKYSLR